MAISGEKPCPGSGLRAGFPGEMSASPDPVLLQDLSMKWTVVAIATGVGTGRGLSSRKRDRHAFLLKVPRGSSTWGYPGQAISRDANPRMV